jgi:hypothetical protein
MRPKMKIWVGRATHFLRWEVHHFRDHFDLVDEPGNDVVLFAFGPDVLESATKAPALRRAIMLLPGWNCNPYHNLDYRKKALDIIESHYDIVFVNPGPLAEAYKSSKKVHMCDFTIDTEMIRCKNLRKSMNSLLHVSANSPQKDWERSEEVMKLTSLPYEVFPPRGHTPHPVISWMKWRLHRFRSSLGLPRPCRRTPKGYVPHSRVIKKYQQYDGFVHVAGEKPSPVYIDGKYTAALLEAGLTGAILFWHDTLGLGNDLETVFNLPLEPEEAAREIRHIRENIDVERHSRLTREEILEKYSPDRSIGYRAARIKELL